MKKTKLLIAGMILMLLGSICFAQDTPYPDVWWREVPGNLKAKGFGITFLAVEKAYEANPSESPEIYMVMEKRHPDTRKVKPADRAFVIQGFFSGKQWRVTQVDFGGEDVPEKFRLNNGRWLNLVKQMHRDDSFPSGGGGSDKEVDGPKPVPPARFVLQRISAFGALMDKMDHDPISRWVRPSVNRTWAGDQPLNGCDPFEWGLQAFDKDGKRLWQHVIAAYGKPVLKSLGKSGKSGADPYYDGCWAPGQYEVDTPQAFGPILDDDTLMVYINNSVLRIRFKDGFPARMPFNVSIMNYSGVMRLKEALGEAGLERALNNSIDAKLYRNEISPNEERNSYFAIQDYFFPQLATSRLLKYLAPRSTFEAAQTL